jgi:hypothetical protein
MILQFDKNKLQLLVLAGPTESFSASAELVEVHEKLESLKQKLVQFQDSEVNPVLKEIEAFVAEFNKAK